MGWAVLQDVPNEVTHVGMMNCLGPRVDVFLFGPWPTLKTIGKLRFQGGKHHTQSVRKSERKCQWSTRVCVYLEASPRKQ